MKWVGISGSWRKMNKELENDVRKNVKKIISRGDGIVTGGALSVDSIATDEALKLNPAADRIKIFLPASLEIFAEHYRMRAKEGIITDSQAEDLITQLKKIKEINPGSIIEYKDGKIIDKETYYKRNSKVVEASDELLAFHVNESLGTKDTIEKARQKGIPVNVFSYAIEKILYTVVLTIQKEAREELKKLRVRYNKYESSSIDPHITLKQPFELLVDLDIINEKLEEIAKETEPFNITPDGVKYFEGENNVAYVSFKDVSQVAALHKKIVYSLRGLVREKYDEEFELDKFLPHITIGEKIPKGTLPLVKKELSTYNISNEIKVEFFSVYSADEREIWEEYKVFNFS
jgi:2'-5' RNA ligase